MATMRQIRSRIRVARNIEQITKAMKMVAVARLKRAQDRVQNARPYAARMRDVVASLAATTAEQQPHPLLVRRPVRRTGIVVITADRGLCGSYNTAAIRRALELINRVDRSSLRLYTIGRKGEQFLRRRGYPIAGVFRVNSSALALSDAASIAAELRQAFETGEVDEVAVVYTQFVSPVTHLPAVLRLLPMEPPAHAGPPDRYIFEPRPQALIGQLVPRFLVNQVFHALLESVASEHGARMSSMSAATDNAATMISGLTLSLNRARQAGITKEISEIVGGAEALKG
ncbi:MAG TPA: ATP synthase F1 subunit gamma [Chthonomonadales bacterium]|nr:ATP synthase F1 subunit gamma [Chthonomonadales bacterium]